MTSDKHHQCFTFLMERGSMKGDIACKGFHDFSNHILKTRADKLSAICRIEQSRKKKNVKIQTNFLIK